MKNSNIRSVLVVIGLAVLMTVPGLGQEKPKTLVETGIEHYKAGRYQETINVLKEVIRTSIDEHDLFLANLYMGYAYFSLPTQEMENAKTQIERAISLNPEYILREDEFVPDFLAFYKKVKEGLTGIGYFESDPPQAKVYLDNTQIGLTPLKKELLAKVYLLRAVKWGYTTFETEIEIKKTEVGNVKIPLSDDKNWKTFIRSSVIFVVLAYLLKSI